MPLLGPANTLPDLPQRVVVNGASGAGKSTLARWIGRLWDLPYTEMDALFHGPGWVPNPDFLDRVEEFSAAPRWVCEFQYDAARPLLADRADLMVWLDTAVPVTMWRITRRTVVRRVRRQELWNGNREGPLLGFFSDPEHVVRWSWRTRHAAAERVAAVLESHPELPVVRLRSRREADHWLSQQSRSRSER